MLAGFWTQDATVAPAVCKIKLSLDIITWVCLLSKFMYH